MSKCSAPIEGHRRPGSAEKCPVHGIRGGRAVSPPPSPGGRPTIVESIRPESGADIHEKSTLAHDSATPPEVLEQLSAAGPSRVRVIVAKNPNASESLLDDLSRDDDMYVRLSVATNPSTPVAILERLADDKNTAVRSHVTENPSAPDALVTRLALVGWGSARPPVSTSPLASPQLMAKIAAEADAKVRTAAAEAVSARIFAALGVDESNIPAVTSLREQAWWEMTADSPEVVLAKLLSPDA